MGVPIKGQAALLAAVVAVFGFGCGDDSGGTPDGGVDGSADGSADGGDSGVGEITYPLLDCDPMVPEFCGYPYPSNVYTVADATTATGRRISFSSTLLRGSDPAPWSESDGFSAGTPILTMLPGASETGLATLETIDDSLAASSPTILIEAATGERVPHYAAIDVRATVAERGFEIRPVVRLKDATRYIVAIRNVVDADGAAVAPSPLFASLRDETDETNHQVVERRALYNDIFGRLQSAGIEPSTLQVAWDFTTASDENNWRWMVHMRDEALALVGNDGPEFTIDSVETDWNTESIAARIFGTVKVPLYMTTPNAGSVLVFGDDGLPEVNSETPWADIPFEVLIPNSATTENPAALLQYGHGLFGEKEQIQSSHFLSLINEYNYILFAVDLQGMSDPDVAPVGIQLLTGNIGGLKTMFDRLHQGFLNSLLAMRMMKTSFAAHETYGSLIDPTEAYYYGISQGGIQGSPYMALSTDVERGVLEVMGQPYALLLFKSVDFDPFLESINNMLKDKREHQLLVALVQSLWDRVEPNGYTHHIRQNPLPGTNTKEVLLRVAIGDHQVTTPAGQLMARTLDIPHLTTGLRSIWGLTATSTSVTGSAYTEYDFGLPGEPLCDIPMSLCDDPHGKLRRLDEARLQLDTFLRTGVVSNTCDGGVCGFSDMSGCEPGEDAAAVEALCDLPPEPEP